MRTVRALCCIAASLAAVPLVGVAPASAKPAEHYTDHYDVEFFDDDFCGSGLPVDGHAYGSVTGSMTPTPSGAPLFFDNYVGTTDLSANGRSVSLSYAGPIRDQSLVDNGDGTITLTSMANGKITTIRDEAGNLLWQQRGRYVYRIVIDLNGTPDDVEDDEFLSEELLAASGLMSDGDFCDAVLGYLYP
jgi:hypothetical protein